MTRGMLFPQDRLAARFGRGDVDYAWRVFHHHSNMLENTGFSSAERILEVGPGRNLGSSLLWWAYSEAKSGNAVAVVCWDVFKNANPETSGYWASLASELLEAQSAEEQAAELNQVRARLREVAQGRRQPQITYRVEPLQVLEDVMTVTRTQFDLIYSQAAIEHIWHIDTFWEAMVRLTRQGGWHSHRIDLADHGRRETNYIEMLEWSRSGYWLTMRFIPGATNRWRASHHLNKLESLGLEIVEARREERDRLPIPLNQVSGEFRTLGEEELRTTTVDVVAIKGNGLHV